MVCLDVAEFKADSLGGDGYGGGGGEGKWGREQERGEGGEECRESKWGGRWLREEKRDRKKKRE